MGYSTDDLSKFLIDGTGPINRFARELLKVEKDGYDTSEGIDALTQKFNAVGKAIGLTEDDLESMSNVMAGLVQGSVDYKAALQALAGFGLEDTTEAQERANKKLEKTKEVLKGAKQAVRDYANSIKDSILGMVSLSTAFTDAQSKQDDAAAGLNDALQTRADAYAKLNALERDRYANAKDLAQAQLDVAAAEAAVNKARTVTAPNYSELFRKQIEDAKKFAGLLKQLRASNLSDAAVSQLLALGPIAGAAVAQDLISGANGMSIGALNSDLATVGAMGYAAGTAGPGEAGILNNTKVGGSGGNYSIYVTSADPKAVVAALKEYMRQNGAVPIKVTGK